MFVKVPEVERCCCCIPLRPGIIIFGYINVIFSVLSIACLVTMTELKKVNLTSDLHLDVVTSSVLFSIFGMGVILNVLLLVAGFQKDVSILRLYSYYAVATSLAALVPTFILLSRQQYTEVIASVLAIGMQIYVIVLVRSEVLKLETKSLNPRRCPEEIVDVPEDETLV